MSVPQLTVNQFAGFGTQGAKFDDSPFRALSYTLNSSLASYNVIGATAYTLTSAGIAQAGNGGSGFVGILCNPEIFPLFGVGGNPLSPSMTLPNYSLAPLCTMGRIYAYVTTQGSEQDLVVFDNTTGALSTIAPNAALPSGKSFAYAKLIVTGMTTPGLCIIEISPTFTIPT